MSKLPPRLDLTFCRSPSSSFSSSYFFSFSFSSSYFFSFYSSFFFLVSSFSSSNSSCLSLSKSFYYLLHTWNSCPSFNVSISPFFPSVRRQIKQQACNAFAIKPQIKQSNTSFCNKYPAIRRNFSIWPSRLTQECCSCKRLKRANVLFTSTSVCNNYQRFHKSVRNNPLLWWFNAETQEFAGFMRDRCSKINVRSYMMPQKS